MTSDPSARRPEVQRFGKYEVLGKIGAGGMAEIYKCRLSGIGGFDKTVVVKRMLPELLDDQELVHMFLDEARIAANLTHPNIVQIYEIDKLGDTPYIAMEYARGPTLARVIRESWKQQKQCARVVAKVLSEIAGALAHAHHAVDHDGRPLNIVHRDVTPHNIVVTAEGAKLLDFGVAKASGRLSHTNAGGIKGKFRYMAPEQLQADNAIVDGRADVFAVGVCLYLAATGRHAYPARDELSVLKAAAAAAFLPPSKVEPSVDPELERIILWAMAPSLAERCPDAKALQQALETYVSQGTERVTSNEVNRFVQRLFGDLSTSDHLVWSAYNDEAISSKRFSSRPSDEDIVGGDVQGASAGPPEELDVDDLLADSVPTSQPGGGAPRRVLLVGAAVTVVLLGALAGLLSLPAPPPATPAAATGLPSAEPSPTPTDDEKAVPPTPVEVAMKAEAPAESVPPTPPPAAAGEPEAPRAQGQLTVVTDVPARVFIDGHFEGTSPLKSTLSATIHTVKVEARGFPSQQKDVSLRANVDTQLPFRLRRGGPVVAVAPKGEATSAGRVVAAAAVQPEPVTPPQPQPAEVAEVAGDGWLNLRTEPWCDVYLNGERLGTTPLNRLLFPAGRHTLKLVNESAKIERTIQVEIRSGQESTTRLRLAE